MLSPDRESPPRVLLTIPEVAFMLGCGRTLVYDLISSKQLPIVKIGRLTRVRVDAVDAFVSGRTTSSTPPAGVAQPYPPGGRHVRSRAAIVGGAGQAKLFDDLSLGDKDRAS